MQNFCNFYNTQILKVLLQNLQKYTTSHSVLYKYYKEEEINNKSKKTIYCQMSR